MTTRTRSSFRNAAQVVEGGVAGPGEVAAAASSNLGCGRKISKIVIDRGLRAKARGPGGVAGGEPDDRNVAGCGMHDRGHRAEAGVDAAEGKPAVVEAVDHHRRTGRRREDHAHPGRVFLDQRLGLGRGHAVQAQPQLALPRDQDDEQPEEGRGGRKRRRRGPRDGGRRGRRRSPRPRRRRRCRWFRRQ